MIVSIFSDDLLTERPVLKGGNAIGLVHGLGDRASIDVDFSMADDFEDGFEEIEHRITHALSDRFDSEGYKVFDQSMCPKPSISKEAKWGGYLYEFKIIEKTRAAELGDDLDRIRREATPMAMTPTGGRKFKIEISKYEYCEQWEEVDFDFYTVRVYTPTMIAAEKL